MTKNNEYNRCFFETLKSLPGYYLDITRATNNEDQRKALKQMLIELEDEDRKYEAVKKLLNIRAS